MSKVDAHWKPEIFEKVLHLREERSPHTLILGNGDVKTPQEAREKVEAFGIDGVMLGRAIFGKPWLFSEREASPEEILDIMEDHLGVFEADLLAKKHYPSIKKHLRGKPTVTKIHHFSLSGSIPQNIQIGNDGNYKYQRS